MTEPMDTTTAQVPTFVKAALAVALLLLVLVRVADILGDYRQSSRVGDAATETTAGADAATEETTAPSPPETAPSAEEAPEQAAPAAGEKTVVVIIPGLNFRTEPSASSDVIRTLPKDSELVLVSSQGGWYQVRDSSGDVGWVSSSPEYVRVEE